MKLYSTNRQSKDVSLEQAVFQSLPPDNGLYMPYMIPTLDTRFIQNLYRHSLQDIAFHISSSLLQGAIPDKDIETIVDEAIDFDAPVVPIHTDVYALELFHGPTLAFKDFGARFMARIMKYFLKNNERQVDILVATSGDTGGAVASGFYDVPGIRVTILYPKGKVSLLQEKQLTTLGKNIRAVEVDGTFDDCQSLVKQAFLDTELQSRYYLSSANSINICRLIPQSFYYFYAYAQVMQEKEKVVFSVPSGNFGNITAGLIAKKMGLPIHHMVASVNANDTFYQYWKTGVYTPKSSKQTISNAMDVGAPSNFIRIQELYKGNLKAIKEDIYSASFTDQQTRQCMRSVYEQTKYILDPHAAIGYLGLDAFTKKEPKDDSTAHIVLETAHPAKFIDEVEQSLGIQIDIPNRLEILRQKDKVATTSIKASYSFFKDYLLA